MDRLRFALVGAGGFGGGHLNVLRNHPRVDLKVVCDASQEVLAPLKEQGIATSGDFRETLSREDLDAAIIVLPPSGDELAEHEALLQVLDKEVKGSCLWRQLAGPAGV